MDINVVWFGVVAFFFLGFLFLEGFDFGVGLMLPVIGRNELDRRQMLAAIGPHWDGNEVWLIAAVACLFAAFPQAYASLMSGSYLLMVAMLFGLIVRGVGMEFRNQRSRRGWRVMWDRLIWGGSFVVTMAWGIILTNMLRGMRIDAQHRYVGTLADVLNPTALVGGMMLAALFALHGANFVSLKTTGSLQARSERVAGRVWRFAGVAMGGYGWLLYSETDAIRNGTVLVMIGAVLALLVTGGLLGLRHGGYAFVASGLTISLAAVALFAALFPRVLVSRLDHADDLTIYTAAASNYSLTVTTYLALGLLPFVLAYQVWNYRVFRQRVSPAHSGH